MTEKPREATPLEYALQAYNRIRTYADGDLSSNEKCILALGKEVQRLATALHRAELSLHRAGNT